jgi:hypothetical protein
MGNAGLVKLNRQFGIRDQLVFTEGPGGLIIGSRTTVVWNPWIDKAKKMKDFGDDEYKTMVCLETTNADTDVISLAPGNTHTLESTIGLI